MKRAILSLVAASYKQKTRLNGRVFWRSYVNGTKMTPTDCRGHSIPNSQVTDVLSTFASILIS